MDSDSTGALPDEYHVRFLRTPFGRMRSRVLGRPRSAPPVVTIMGMAVSDYLLPGLAALDWTQAHLVDLPGLAGSSAPPVPLDVPGYADAVADWLRRADLPPVVLVGHSSGTQIAARTATMCPELVGALVLASPTVDPVARSWPRVLLRWRWDSRFPLPGLERLHHPEWFRAGLRQIVHLISVHLRDRIEDVLPDVHCPTLVLRGAQDKLSTGRWVERLTELTPNARSVTVPGPHTFPWRDPGAWSEPIRELADEIGREPKP